MKKNELIELRKIVQEEINKRERIKYLLKLKTIKEYLELTSTPSSDLSNETLDDILDRILKTFKIEETNGIFVCTGAYYIDYRICYEDTDYYSRYVDIDDKYAEYKLYSDIESGNIIHASKEKNTQYHPLIEEVENNNIVLNPYNSNKDNNGYHEVKLEFFKNALEYGQTKSKKMLLERYPRLNGR